MKNLDFIPPATLFKGFCLLSELEEETRDREDMDGRKWMNMARRRAAEMALLQETLASQLLNPLKRDFYFHCFLSTPPCVTEPNLGPLAQCTAKPIYWHRVVVKESIALTARRPTWGQAWRMSSYCSKDPNSPRGFREGFLKTGWGRGSQGVWSVCAQFSDWLMVR